MFRSLRLYAAVLLAALASPAQAGTEILPSRLTLTDQNPVGVLNVINTRGVPAGYDVAVYKWSQDPSGNVTLEPTDRVAVEPKQLVVLPNGRAKVQIKALQSAPASGQAEALYRVKISERVGRKRERGEENVQFIASFTLPVFHKPPQTSFHGHMVTTPLQDGQFTFAVYNDGTEHRYIEKALVTGLDAAGQEVFRMERQGWYLLPQDHLDFKAALAASDCRKTARLIVRAQVLDSMEGWVAELAPTPEVCGEGTVSHFPVAGLTPYAPNQAQSKGLPAALGGQ